MNIRDIFKIILVLQLLACALATYGHPDAEVFSLRSQPSRDELILAAAIKRGMDGEAVAELLRTKKPVVKSTTTPSGFTKKTTYKMEPDGSISSKSTIQKTHRYVYNSESIPDELKNTPTGTITRTFADSDGNKVTQTVSVNQGKPSSVTDSDDLSGDWFSKSFPSWQDETPSSSPAFNTAHKTIASTYVSPHGERRTIQSWSSDPEFSEPETPLTTSMYSPIRSSTSTRTYIKPNGDKHVIQTTSSTNVDSSRPKSTPVGDTSWPKFNYPDISVPFDIVMDSDDSHGWEILKEPKGTTNKKVDAWNWLEFPTYPTTTTTTVKPTLFVEAEPKPLPNLNEFLISQYGQKPNREPGRSTTPKPVTSTPKIINIEDLPVVEVLHNGKPASESILKTLPPHLTPRTPAEHVLSIEHKHPIEENVDEDIEKYTPKTNIRTYSKTHIGHEKPTLKDLDPQMQDILRNAGIVPEIEGDNITKTRKEPDGRIITTSYKVNTIPTVQHYVPPPQIYTHTFNFNKPFVPLATLTPHSSPIAEFLAKLGLTKFDIVSNNGHYSKTLIDENGDVLTATFVLSSPQGIRIEKKLEPHQLNKF